MQSQDACNNTVRSLILSRIDYANSLLYGAREVDLRHVQRLQNKAVRLVFAWGRDLFSSAHLLHSKKESCSTFFCLYINVSNGNHQVIFMKISPCTTQMDLEVAGGSALLLTSPSWLFHIPKGRLGTVHSLLLSLNCGTSCRVPSGKRHPLPPSSTNSKLTFFPAYDLLV